MQNIKSEAKAAYKWLDKHTFGIPGILARAFQSVGETNAVEAAASVAFFALFSLFPTVIIVISVVSSVLRDASVQQMIVDFVDDTLPTAQRVVNENIERALELQGTIQIVSSIGLLWGASAVFNALAFNINRAWHTAEERSFLVSRLIAFGMIALLALLFLLWFALTTVLNLLPVFEIPLFGSLNVYETYAWSILSGLVPSIFLLIIFLVLYRWVPRVRVRWREALVGALVAAIGFQITTAGFRWYLTSGLANYQLIYGSLGTVVALMLWMYFSSLVVLFGAHLSAAIAFKTRISD